MLQWMDTEEDPCEDFFSYACGGFQDTFKDMPMANTLKLMQQSNSLLVEQILHQKEDKLAKTEVESRVFHKAVDYLQSCLDTDTINARGFTPIVPLAKKLVSLVRNPDVDVPTILATANANAVYLLFRSAYTKVENADPKDLRMQFFPAPAFDIKPGVVEATLQRFIDHKVIDLPSNMDLADVSEWISQFEKLALKAINIHNSKTPRQKQLPEMYISMDSLNKRTGMDWNNYFAPLNLTGAEKNWFLWGDGDLWVDSLKALRDYDRDSFAFLVLWRLATAHFSKLGKDHYDFWSTFIWPRGKVSEYDNDSEEKARMYQSDCVRELGVHLNYLTGHVYVKYAFNDTQRTHASELIDILFGSYRDLLGNVTWMDKETKAAALKKLGNMVKVVGYPDWVGNVTAVDEYYENLKIDKKLYFENAVQAHVFYDYRSSQHQVGRELERSTVYFSYPYQINAFHLSDYIQIQINSGILQRPLYSSKNPNSMNFGSIGAVIGHEICHSFDAKGYKIDYRGVKRPWWSDKSNELFAQGKDCFVEQYGEYEVEVRANGEAMNVNGTLTVSENIADNGGLHVALMAWRKSLGERREEREKEKMEGFNGLTALQTFFIAYAQTWCSVKNYAHTRFLVKGNAHAPNDVRVKGVLSNSEDFARAFQCPKGSVYNPERKCKLY